MHKRLFPLTVFCFVVLIFSATPYHSIAATYYVNNSGSPTCKDSKVHSGNFSEPWCSIKYGTKRIAGGDKLYVLQGTYNETFPIRGLIATQEKATRIKTYPGHDVIINGVGVHTGRVFIEACESLIFEGFTIKNMNQGLFVSGGSQNITIRNCTIRNIGQEGIHIKDNSKVTIQRKFGFNCRLCGKCPAVSR